MKDFDSFTTRFGCSGVCRFGLREEAGNIERHSSWSGTEGAAERVADIPSVKAIDVRKC